eukprot:scaffold1815_cov147-Skeletonema_dohrnii-CCMP3373.AAC.10
MALFKLAASIFLLASSPAYGFTSPTSLITRSKQISNSNNLSFYHDSFFPSTSIATKTTSSSSLSALPISSTISTVDISRTIIGLLLAQKISNSGYKKQSLSKSGAISAFLVASFSLATSFRNGLTLLAFYWTSSKLTRVGSKIKGKLEEGHTEGGERGASQVFACSLIAVLCACVRRILVGNDGPLLSTSVGLLGDQLTLAYVAFFACCAGDTWASELGVLSKTKPRLIIKPWKQVPPGTNGGISFVGLAASAVGGTLMGLIHGLLVPGGIASMLPFNLPSMLGAISSAAFKKEVLILSLVGFIGGFGGSLLDSVLGATIQVTYYDDVEEKIVKRSGPNAKRVGGLAFLSNEMVNVVSTALSALIAALTARSLLSIVI